jgi:hypothetical protein
MAFLGKMPGASEPSATGARAALQMGIFRGIEKYSRIFRIALLSLLFGALASAWPVIAQEAGVHSEYQVKAAFLYNFAKFIEWPSNTFSANNAPIIIGVLGKNPFDGELERMAKDKVLNGHPLIIQPVASSQDTALKRCQILFIQSMDKRKTSEVLELLKGKPTLTVSETEGFIQWGGMINFVMDGKRVRFEINDTTATQAGLRISSKLLSLSKKPEAAP